MDWADFLQFLVQPASPLLVPQDIIDFVNAVQVRLPSHHCWIDAEISSAVQETIIFGTDSIVVIVRCRAQAIVFVTKDEVRECTSGFNSIVSFSIRLFVFRILSLIKETLTFPITFKVDFVNRSPAPCPCLFTWPPN